MFSNINLPGKLCFVMIIFFSPGYTRRARDLNLSNVESLIRMSE